MEHKLVKVPFDLELAKKITNKECEGKIITRNGRNARIVCFDMKSDSCIVAIIQDEFDEHVYSYPKDGCIILNKQSGSDLILEIPEYMTFKDGDIIKLSNDTYTWLSIIKDIDLADAGKGGLLYFTNDYVSILINDGNGSVDIDTYSDAGCNVEKATEEEKQKLIASLKESKDPKAKEYLKRFFGIEQKQEYEFTFKQTVLVRSICGEWSAAEFSHKRGSHFCVFGGVVYQECIPYNEHTAHLIGTTENWEG